MLCPISGKVPEQPVVTPKGIIYEKRLLEKYRSKHGDFDPVSGEAFDAEKLIEIQNAPTVDATVASLSVAQLLGRVQSECDVLVLQNFKLRQALDQMKGQLTQSLYQHDAACRVIARLTRERDIIKAKVASGAAMINEPSSGFTQEVLQEISDNAADLQNTRKQRAPTHIAESELTKFKHVGSSPVHEAARPGVNDVVVKNQPGRGSVAFSCGEDGYVNMTSLSTMSRITRFQAAESALLAVDTHPDADVIIAGGKDNAVRIFTGTTSDSDISFNLHKSNRCHSAAVSSVEIHPLGTFVMSSGLDHKISFTDIESGNAMGPSILDKAGLSSVKFHPDGNIFLTGGSDGTCGIWDLREMKEKARATAVEGGFITDLQVNENGYYLSTADSTGHLKIWDLRKFSSAGATAVTSQVIAPGITKGAFKLAMCPRSNLISAVGSSSEGAGIVRFGSIAKKAKDIVWGDLLDSVHSDVVTRVRFMNDKDEVVTCSKDNTVALWRLEK